jgi:hypothetical protein
VISWKGWLIIAAIALILIYLVISGSTTESFSSKTILVQTAVQQSTSFIDNIFTGSVALLLSLGTLAAFLLLGVESLYRRTQLRTV